ncbi:hypothetical protein TWF730_000343 [Orbilia blumenaviensis]|uniref:Nucleoside phosphorylase domain-containing protein n=1 Tax=Orbilia blumenaviensis TaxID=1796055 RepID=A0AAV9VP14_9PEZI
MAQAVNSDQATAYTQRHVHNDYTIAWVTILEEEVVAASLMLDQTHPGLEKIEGDDNFYKLGKVDRHNVVIMRPSRAGADAVSHATTNMARTFRNLRFVFLIGVGGGAPQEPVGEDADDEDLRLGDVVVSFQENENQSAHGYVLQYDYGKYMSTGKFEIRSYIRKPQPEIINCVRGWKVERLLGNSMLQKYIQDSLEKIKQSGTKSLKRYRFPGWEKDRLYKVVNETIGDLETNGSTGELVTRLARESEIPIVHYGLIASANAVMGDGRKRDELRDEYGVMCFEMEAAGLMNDFPCIVIRGISNYSYGSKNDDWKHWASLTAAAAAKDLLSTIQPTSIETTKTVIAILDHKSIASYYPKSV